MIRYFSMLFLFIGTAFLSFSQLKQGQIDYEMAFISDDPEMDMAKEMMAGSKMSLSFVPGKSRSEVTMGLMGTMTTISIEGTNECLMLMDMLGMKYAMETTLDESGDEESGTYTVAITKETRNILGYTCTKALLTDQDGNVITVWFTDQIDVQTNGLQYYNSSMPGFPLCISIAEGTLITELTAVNVDKNVNSNLFDLTIPEGYELKTEEEMELMGQ